MLQMGILMSIQTLNHPQFLIGFVVFRNKTHTQYRTRSSNSSISSVSLTDDSGNYEEPSNGNTSLMKTQRSSASCIMLSQQNTIGIIGGVSVLSTLVFLEKLACWSSRNGKECPPFVVCSDPVLSKALSLRGSFPSSRNRMDHIKLNQEVMIKNLQHKRKVLQQSGARGFAMPCHLSHAWHSEISEDSSLPFLHIGDCVAMELKKAKMKPIHAASTVRIGLLTTDSFFVVCYYKEKLQSQGFEVVLLDKETEEHLLVPAVEALQRKDIEGARNLLRIAIHVLLVRGVNVVILASDDLLGILPHNDPLIRKCIDPMDALARSIIHWAETTAKVPGRF
jgi:aspartate/glutamate racemase